MGSWSDLNWNWLLPGPSMPMLVTDSAESEMLWNVIVVGWLVEPRPVPGKSARRGD